MTSDQALVDALDRILPVVSAYGLRDIDTSYNGMHAAVPESIETAIGKLAFEHVLFARKGNIVFGGKLLHFNPQQVPRLLINKAVRVGTEKALHWLTRVYTMERADIRYVAEVFNLRLEAPYALSNGVRFETFDSIPNTKMGGQYKAYHRRPSSFFNWARPIAAVHEIRNVRGVTKFEGFARSDEIDLAVIAHVLAHEEAAPFVGSSWVEFVDDELEEADMPRASASMSRYDGPDPGHPPTWSMGIDETPSIEAFLQLPKAVRDKVEVAASRLIMARNRVSLSNAALDGSICLESLLSDSQGELTYKLALRAALLIGSDIEERKKVRKQVQEFYRLRGKVAHGEHRSDPNDSTVVVDGMKVCARVLSRIVELKAIPHWPDFEIGEARTMA